MDEPWVFLSHLQPESNHHMPFLPFLGVMLNVIFGLVALLALPNLKKP